MFPADGGATSEEKDLLYKQVRALYRRGTAQGPSIVLGVFNARALKQQSPEESMIGPHVFDPSSTGINHQSDNVIDNRNRLLDFCRGTDSILANTFYEKPNEKLATYRFKRNTDHGPPLR